MLGRLGDLPSVGFLIQVDEDKVDMNFLANMPYDKLNILCGILSRPTQLPYTPIPVADVNYNYTIAMPISQSIRCHDETRCREKGHQILLLVSTAAPATIVVENLS
ncbi:hypothetical protein FSST1_012369 [Fusarium sambucinum]